VGRNLEIAVVFGPGGLLHQSHPGFHRRSTRLTTIAGYTGTDHILPGMLPAPVTRDDMIQSELAGAPTAILAGKMVAFEDLEPGQFPAGVRGALNHIGQPDYRGDHEVPVNRTDKAGTIL